MSFSQVYRTVLIKYVFQQLYKKIYAESDISDAVFNTHSYFTSIEIAPPIEKIMGGSYLRYNRNFNVDSSDAL